LLARVKCAQKILNNLRGPIDFFTAVEPSVPMDYARKDLGPN
jgi:hypothetical protein